MSIITSHIKKCTPELDVALGKITALRAEDEASVGLDEALKYLLQMVDINELYNVALASYDFDVVLMVAEKSQMVGEE